MRWMDTLAAQQLGFLGGVFAQSTGHRQHPLLGLLHGWSNFLRVCAFEGETPYCRGSQQGLWVRERCFGTHYAGLVDRFQGRGRPA